MPSLLLTFITDHYYQVTRIMIQTLAIGAQSYKDHNIVRMLRNLALEGAELCSFYNVEWYFT